MSSWTWRQVQHTACRGSECSNAADRRRDHRRGGLLHRRGLGHRHRRGLLHRRRPGHGRRRLLARRRAPHHRGRPGPGRHRRQVSPRCALLPVSKEFGSLISSMSSRLLTCCLREHCCVAASGQAAACPPARCDGPPSGAWLRPLCSAFPPLPYPSAADCKADPTWQAVAARLDGNAAYAGATNDSQPFDPSVKEYLSFSTVDLAQLVYDPDLPMWGGGGAGNKTCRWWFWSSL